MSENAEEGSPAAATPSSDNTPVEAPEKKKREYKDFGHEQEKATRTFFFFLHCHVSDG